MVGGFAFRGINSVVKVRDPRGGVWVVKRRWLTREVDLRVPERRNATVTGFLREAARELGGAADATPPASRD